MSDSRFRTIAFLLRDKVTDTYELLNAASVVDDYVADEIAKSLRVSNSVSLDTITRRSPVIQDFATQNKKIYAIKELRTLTGCGLREAKESVERIYDWDAIRRTSVTDEETQAALDSLRTKLMG